MANSTRAQQSFPLSALFVLIAVCAVIAAMVGPLARAVVADDVSLLDAGLASFLGALIVMLMGAVVGLYHYRRARGAAWGILVGAGIGMVVGPAVLSPSQAFPSLLSMSLGGAVILVVVGAAFRNRRQR